jgi:hypothetical protein
MAHFEATVRILDVTESDAPAARRLIEERLREGGFSRWHILSLGVQGAMVHAAHAVPRPTRRARRVEVSYAGGGLLVAAVVAWTLWFFWLLAE